MVMMTSDQLIAYYGRYLTNLNPHDDADDLLVDAMNVLTARDAIEDRWAELTAKQRSVVQELDTRLVKKHDLFRDDDLLPNALSTDRRRWWWFLHEGPQVKAEAEAITN